MEVGSKAVAYGLAASELLAGQVAALKSSDYLSPVTIVVASNYVSVAARRALAGRPGGVANVNFTTIDSLAEEIGGRRLSGAGCRPASTPLITAAIRAALHEAPGVFEPVANHPATEQALAKAYRELRRIPDAAALEVAECSARAADVFRICREAYKRLAGRWYDDEDLLAAATDELETAPHPEIGPVIVHLLPELSASEARFIRALASRG